MASGIAWKCRIALIFPRKTDYLVSNPYAHHLFAVSVSIYVLTVAGFKFGEGATFRSTGMRLVTSSYFDIEYSYTAIKYLLVSHKFARRAITFLYK